MKNQLPNKLFNELKNQKKNLTEATSLTTDAVHQSVKNNKELGLFITSLNEDLEVASTKDDISTIIEKCVDFPYQIKFDLKLHYIALALLSIMALVFALSEKNWGNNSNFVFIGALLVGFVVLFRLIFSASNKIAKLNEDLKAKAMAILYKGTPVSSQQLQQQRAMFQDFYRGNYKNTLTSGLEIDFHSARGALRPSVVDYHYVDEHKKKVKDSNGNWQTEYTYKDYYRQGVIFPIGKPTSILISRFRHSKIYPENFIPASNTFKKMFHVQGESEFDIAKLLEPHVVLKIEEAGRVLKDLTIEFSDYGDMLICQKNTKLLELKTEFDLSNPKAFRDELFTSSYGKLDEILSLANELIKHIK